MAALRARSLPTPCSQAPASRYRRTCRRGRRLAAGASPPDLQDCLAQLDAALAAALAADTREGAFAAEERATAAVRSLPGGSRLGSELYGGAPKRQYTLEELRLNRVEASRLLSPEDDTLQGVRRVAQLAAAAGVVAATTGLHLGPSQLLLGSAGVLFLAGADQIAFGGGVETAALDALARAGDGTYARRVASHEAGHFMVAYLVGILPKGYTLGAWEALQKHGLANLQAGCVFCDTAFQAEVEEGRLSSSSLDRFCCVALAGCAVEYIIYDRAEGGLSDIRQLDTLLQALRFTQAKSDDQVRWAVLNTVALLRKHAEAHAALADAMARGATVAECVALLESTLQPLPAVGVTKAES
mmetsp:Transcript_12188/g.42257  ORF Transcript_12188/g.42257 Transcript_12188/m.42257 type:complete len:357 (-) Transcript_12188:701-1771(-)